MNHIIKKGLLRNIYLRNSTQSRNIYTTFTIMDEAVNTIKENPFYEKYKNELTKLQRTSPEEFIQRASNVRKSKLKEEIPEYPEQSSTGKTNLNSKPTLAKGKKLEDIVRLELFADKSSDEIKYIWSQHFAKSKGIFGCLSAKLYGKILQQAKKYPMFIYPIPKSQGYEFVLSQFSGNEIHFTSLINYQAYQENAPESLTIVHYPELSQEKDIVLMYGEINDNVLTTSEAQFLANQVQLYYGIDDQVRTNLVEEFHDNPSTFDHMKLISQIENLDLNLAPK